MLWLLSVWTKGLIAVSFMGDDWAEGHHDVELEDESGRLLARARLPEGFDGIARLHALVAEHAPPEWADLDPEQVAAQVVIGTETDRGPWVTALRAAGYLVCAIDPLSSARYRQRHSTSGARATPVTRIGSPRSSVSTVPIIDLPLGTASALMR